MKNSTLIVLSVLLAACGLFFTSCTLEKRHYRSGYYIQHSSGAYNRDDSQKKSANAEENIAGFRANTNSEYTDSTGVTSKGDRRENNVVDSATFVRSVNEGSEQINAVNENKICSENKVGTTSRAKVNDHAKSNLGKQHKGAAFTILGAILIGIGLIMFGSGLVGLAIVLALAGVVFLCLGLRKKKESKNGGQKKKLYNTKPLWISALIFTGIFILCLILAAVNEILLIVSLLALPIALILVIAASVRDRRNRKANPEANDKEKGKKGVGILKKILKWILIILGALTLIGLIGFIGSVAS